MARPDQLLLLSNEPAWPGENRRDHGWAAVLHLPAEPDPGDSPHAASCACCVARPPVAAELTRLFHARGRGETRFFTAAVAVLADPAAASLRAVLHTDRFVRGCFVEAY